MNTLGRYAQLVPDDVPELYDALSDPNPFVRRMACGSLPHRPGAQPVVPILIRSLGDRAPEVRLAAASRLGSIGLDAEPALVALRHATEDREGMVRDAAAEAVRRIESKVDVFRTKLLPDALEDLASPDPEMRRGAAEMLAGFGPHSEPAVPALIRGLDAPEAMVRLAIVETLGRIGPAAREALPALAARDADPDERVRRSAKAAAGIIRGENTDHRWQPTPSPSRVAQGKANPHRESRLRISGD